MPIPILVSDIAVFSPGNLMLDMCGCRFWGHDSLSAAAIQIASKKSCGDEDTYCLKPLVDDGETCGFRLKRWCVELFQEHDELVMCVHPRLLHPTLRGAEHQECVGEMPGSEEDLAVAELLVRKDGDSKTINPVRRVEETNVQYFIYETNRHRGEKTE